MKAGKAGQQKAGDNGANKQIWPAPSKTEAPSSKHGDEDSSHGAKDTVHSDDGDKAAGKTDESKKGKKGKGKGKEKANAGQSTEAETTTETIPTGIPTDVGWSYDGEIPRQPWPLDTPSATTETPTETAKAEKKDAGKSGKGKGGAGKQKDKKAEKNEGKADANKDGKKQSSSANSMPAATDATGLKQNPDANAVGTHSSAASHHHHKTATGHPAASQTGKPSHSAPHETPATTDASDTAKKIEYGKGEASHAGKKSGEKAGKNKGKGKVGKKHGNSSKSAEAPLVTEVPELNRMHKAFKCIWLVYI